VREARAEDAGEIARVQIETWRVAYAHVLPASLLAGLSVEQQAANWVGWLQPPDHIVLVAERGGRISGFASAMPGRGEDRVGELQALYVEPSAWDRGLGRALIAEVERRLREAGCREAVLRVFEDNPRARRFYEAGGWAAELTRPEDFFGVETSVVWYRKPLS
jgi:GNAT superfamily N-acetyltransferase